MNVCGYSWSSHCWMEGLVGYQAVYNDPDVFRCRCGAFRRSWWILAEVLTPSSAPPPLWRTEVAVGCQSDLQRGSSACWMGSSSPAANPHVLLPDCCTAKINPSLKKRHKKTAVITLPMKRTSAFIELLPGHCGGSSMALSPSESDLELLSESLELGDSSPLECAALTELQKSTNIQIKDTLFLLIGCFGL